MDIRVLKNEFRTKYIDYRRSLPESERAERDRKIAQNFQKLISYRHSSQILFYASTYDEINTEYLFSSALASGKTCYFPKCYEKSQMTFYRVDSPNGLCDDMFGIKAPIEEKNQYVPFPSDIILVPAITYDREGYRLGYGKGFYDRFLTDFLGIRIGFAYTDMIVPKLPRGRYDISVDILVTEKGVTSF